MPFLSCRPPAGRSTQKAPGLTRGLVRLESVLASVWALWKNDDSREERLGEENGAADAKTNSNLLLSASRMMISICIFGSRWARSVSIYLSFSRLLVPRFLVLLCHSECANKSDAAGILYWSTALPSASRCRQLPAWVYRLLWGPADTGREHCCGRSYSNNGSGGKLITSEHKKFAPAADAAHSSSLNRSAQR